jgi:hypothetical protein
MDERITRDDSFKSHCLFNYFLVGYKGFKGCQHGFYLREASSKPFFGCLPPLLNAFIE